MSWLYWPKLSYEDKHIDNIFCGMPYNQGIW